MGSKIKTWAILSLIKKKLICEELYMNRDIEKYCSDCDYQGTTLYYYKRHISSKTHIKVIQNKTLYNKIHNNIQISNLNIQNYHRIIEFNDNGLKHYNDLIHENLQNKNIKLIEPLQLFFDNDKIVTSTLNKNKLTNASCPWCLEYVCINNLIKNENIDVPKMSLNNCLEHMKTCTHKTDHKIITKNLALALTHTLKIISDNAQNFKIIANDYELIKKQNDELMQLKNKFDKLKTKYDDLKKENNRLHVVEGKYDVLLKMSTSNNNNSTDNVHYTINGNNANVTNINLMTYIDNHCKDAIPIDAIDNNRKIIENKYKDYIKVITNNSQTEVLNDKDIIVSKTSTASKEINTTKNYVLQKMFVEEYNNNKNAYHVFIADFLIKFHKKQETSKQPIWNTDSSRYSYIIKTLPDDWIKDKQGVVLLDKCVNPFLDHIDELLREYSTYLEKRITTIQIEFMEQTKKRYITKYKNKNLNKYDFMSMDDCLNCNEDMLDFSASRILGKKVLYINSSIRDIIELLACINKEGFGKKVIKEITPHFTIDKTKLIIN